MKITPDREWLEITPKGKPVWYIEILGERIVSVDERYRITKLFMSAERDELLIKIEKETDNGK